MNQAQLSDPQVSTCSPSTERYAMVDRKGRVIGVCEWDGQSDLNRDTFRLVQTDFAGIGDSYIDERLWPAT
jgi:hypothetical protein